MRPTQEFAFWTKNPARAYSSRVYFLVNDFGVTLIVFAVLLLLLFLGRHTGLPLQVAICRTLGLICFAALTTLP